MKNLVQTGWIRKATSWRDWSKAQIYKTPSGKLALRIIAGYGGEIEPTSTIRPKPKYYTTVLGLYDALEANGLADAGIGIDDIKEVLNK